MDKFTTLTAVAAPLPRVNIDTDAIIPKQYLKTIKRTGLGKGLFSEMRYQGRRLGEPRLRAEQARLQERKNHRRRRQLWLRLVREHAPWALKDFGISCVISTSFADIFYTNCFQNGLLPAIVSPEDLEKLMDDASRGANATLTVDLEKQEIRGPDGGMVKFEIGAFQKHCMLNGLDGIGITEQKAAAIDAYEQKHQSDRPWV